MSQNSQLALEASGLLTRALLAATLALSDEPSTDRSCGILSARRRIPYRPRPNVIAVARVIGSYARPPGTLIDSSERCARHVLSLQLVARLTRPRRVPENRSGTPQPEESGLVPELGSAISLAGCRLRFRFPDNPPRWERFQRNRDVDPLVELARHERFHEVPRRFTN